MITEKVRPWLTRLYPRDWRNRYGVEFEALLDECLHSPLDVVDVFLGAVDAHLQLLNGENVSWRLLNMLNKLRTSILIVFAAYIGFIIAGFSLVGLADDSPMIPMMKTNMLLKSTWITIQAGAAIALLAVVIGGLPLALTVIRAALRGNRRSQWMLLVPVFSFIALIIYGAFLFSVTTGRIPIQGVVKSVSPDNFPIGNKLLLGGLMLVFVLGAIASTCAVWKAVTDVNDEEGNFAAFGRSMNIKIYTFAFVPAVITTACMLVMLVGTAAWGWIAFSALPDIFTGNYGVWQTSTQAWYFGIIAIMLVCSLAALTGLLRSRSARTA